MEIQKAFSFSSNTPVDVVQLVYNTDVDKLIEWCGATTLVDGTIVLGGQKARLGDIFVETRTQGFKIYTRSSFQNNYYFEGASSWKTPSAMNRRFEN